MQDSPLSTMENLCDRIITIIYNIIYFIYIIITNIKTCEMRSRTKDNVFALLPINIFN